MKVHTALADWRLERRALDGARLGFVPTMGALHAGHRSLVNASLEADAVTVVSIYVNPTQFDRPEDLAAYPRDLEQDLALLEDWGAQHVLCPRYEDIYPDGFRYRVVESGLSERWCGAHRPGHFEGMLTVVLRLLNLVRPARAYFGEKDYQQLLLVRGMVEALFLDVDIVGCPIVREADGLAMSSRNRRLDPAQRSRAAALNRELRRAASAGEAAASLEQQGFKVEYVDDHQGRRLAAVQLGEVRLIDNVPLAADTEYAHDH